MGILEGIVVLAFLLVGIFFNSLGVLSLYRFPDVYTRMHGATKCSTFGTLFTGFSVVVYSLFRYFSAGETRFLVIIIHTLVAMAILLVTNATGAHAIARAAHRSRIDPKFAVVDRLAEKEGRRRASL